MKMCAKGLHGRLWDLEEDEEILEPIWFDEASGLFEAYQVNPFGRIKRDRAGDKLTWMGKGKIKWVTARPGETLRRSVGHKCMECTRDAEWSVGDETPVAPMLQGGVLFSRGRLTGQRHYCSFHYRAPRIVDAKGEVMSTWDDAGGVRPQWHS